MFEQASRLKLRFSTSLGSLTVEDLWDLPLLSLNRGACLDEVAKALNREVKASTEDSFVLKKDEVDIVVQIKFDIVKHIIEVKLAEVEVESNRVEIKAKKQRIMAIMENKEDENLQSKSAEELQDLLDAL